MRGVLWLLIPAALLLTGCQNLIPDVRTIGAPPTATVQRIPTIPPAPTVRPGGEGGATATPAARTPTPTFAPTFNPATATPTRPAGTITPGPSPVVTRTVTPGATAAPALTPGAGATGTITDVNAMVQATVNHALANGVTGFDVSIDATAGSFARATVTRRAGGAQQTAYLRWQNNTWTVISFGPTTPANAAQLGIPPALLAAQPGGPGNTPTPSPAATGAPGGPTATPTRPPGTPAASPTAGAIPTSTRTP